MMPCNTRYPTYSGRWNLCGPSSLSSPLASSMSSSLSSWGVPCITQSQWSGSSGWSFSCFKLGLTNEHTCSTRNNKCKGLLTRTTKKTESYHLPLKSDTRNYCLRMKMQRRILTLKDKSNKPRRIETKPPSESWWLTKKPSKNTKNISKRYPTSLSRLETSIGQHSTQSWW